MKLKVKQNLRDFIFAVIIYVLIFSLYVQNVHWKSVDWKSFTKTWEGKIIWYMSKNLP